MMTRILFTISTVLLGGFCGVQLFNSIKEIIRDYKYCGGVEKAEIVELIGFFMMTITNILILVGIWMK